MCVVLIITRTTLFISKIIIIFLCNLSILGFVLLFVILNVLLSVLLSVHMSVLLSPPICPSVLPFCPTICPFVFYYVCPSVWPSFCPFVFPSLPYLLSVLLDPSFCLSFFMSVVLGWRSANNLLSFSSPSLHFHSISLRFPPLIPLPFSLPSPPLYFQFPYTFPLFL